MSPAPDKRPGLSPVAFGVAGSEMVSFTLVGLAIDWISDSMPWATVSLTILGVMAAMFHLARMVQSANRPRSPGGS